MPRSGCDARGGGLEAQTHVLAVPGTGDVVPGPERGEVRTLGRGPVKTRELEAIIPRLRKLLAAETAVDDGTEMRILWAEPGGPPVPIMMPATSTWSARSSPR